MDSAGFDDACLMPVQPLSPKQIKALRDKRGRLSSNTLPIAWLSLP